MNDPIPRGHCGCRSHRAHKRELQRIIDDLDVAAARRWSTAHGMPEGFVAGGKAHPFTDESIEAALHKLRAVSGTFDAARTASRVWCGERGMRPGVTVRPAP